MTATTFVVSGRAAGCQIILLLFVSMNKIFTSLAALSLGLLLAGCGSSGNSNPTPSVSPRTQLLAGTKWRITAIIAASSFAGQTITRDAYASVGSCKRDDYLKFETNLTLTQDEGATRCSTSSPQSKQGTWSFNTAETEITTVDPSIAVGSLGRTVVAEVLQLTSTALQVRTTNTQTQGGITVISTATTTYAPL